MSHDNAYISTVIVNLCMNKLVNIFTCLQISLTYCELLVDSQCKVTVGKKKGADKTSQPSTRYYSSIIDIMVVYNNDGIMKCD